MRGFWGNTKFVFAFFLRLLVRMWFGGWSFFTRDGCGLGRSLIREPRGSSGAESSANWEDARSALAEDRVWYLTCCYSAGESHLLPTYICGSFATRKRRLRVVRVVDIFAVSDLSYTNVVSVRFLVYPISWQLGSATLRAY